MTGGGRRLEPPCLGGARVGGLLLSRGGGGGWSVNKIDKTRTRGNRAYLLVCLEDFVLFFGVSEIDFSLFNGLQILGSLTRMILWGVGGDWAVTGAWGDPDTGPPASLLSPLKLPSAMFNSF